MIKPVRGWLDSDGTLYLTREDACRAEMLKLVSAHLKATLPPPPAPTLSIEWMAAWVASNMFDIDKMIGLAVREDSRVGVAQ